MQIGRLKLVYYSVYYNTGASLWLIPIIWLPF